jgi:hypothetical protein
LQLDLVGALLQDQATMGGAHSDLLIPEDEEMPKTRFSQPTTCRVRHPRPFHSLLPLRKHVLHAKVVPRHQLRQMPPACPHA